MRAAKREKCNFFRPYLAIFIIDAVVMADVKQQHGESAALISAKC